TFEQLTVFDVDHLITFSHYAVKISLLALQDVTIQSPFQVTIVAVVNAREVLNFVKRFHCSSVLVATLSPLYVVVRQDDSQRYVSLTQKFPLIVEIVIR